MWCAANDLSGAVAGIILTVECGTYCLNSESGMMDGFKYILLFEFLLEKCENNRFEIEFSTISLQKLDLRLLSILHKDSFVSAYRNIDDIKKLFRENMLEIFFGILRMKRTVVKSSQLYQLFYFIKLISKINYAFLSKL